MKYQADVATLDDADRQWIWADVIGMCWGWMDETTGWVPWNIGQYVAGHQPRGPFRPVRARLSGAGIQTVLLSTMPGVIFGADITTDQVPLSAHRSPLHTELAAIQRAHRCQRRLVPEHDPMRIHACDGDGCTWTGPNADAHIDHVTELMVEYLREHTARHTDNHKQGDNPMMDPSPGPEESHHLWGDDEHDLATLGYRRWVGAGRSAAPPPAYYHADCRYSHKRAFDSEQAAVTGSHVIRATVEQRGELYVQLYPHVCPDGGHWHLTSRDPQSQSTPVPAEQLDPAVWAAKQTIQRWTTEGWDASRDLIALEAARAMAQPIREMIESCEEYGDDLDLASLKALVYAKWEL